jgi:hypothetical protein
MMSALRRPAVEGGSYRVVVSLTGLTLWLLSLGIFDKKYAHATAGSSDEPIAPDLFTANTPLGLYQGVTEQVVMSRTPGSFRTVLLPRGSSKKTFICGQTNDQTRRVGPLCYASVEVTGQFMSRFLISYCLSTSIPAPRVEPSLWTGDLKNHKF